MSSASAASATLKTQPTHPSSQSASRATGSAKAASAGEPPSFAKLLTAADEAREAPPPPLLEINLQPESDDSDAPPRKRRTVGDAATDSPLGMSTAQTPGAATDGEEAVSPLLQGLLDWRGYQPTAPTPPPTTGNPQAASATPLKTNPGTQLTSAGLQPSETPTELLFTLPSEAAQSSTPAAMAAAAGNAPTNGPATGASRSKAPSARGGLATTNTLQATLGANATTTTAGLAAAQLANTTPTDARSGDPRSSRSTMDLARNAFGTAGVEASFSTGTPSATTAARTDTWTPSASLGTDASLALGAATGLESSLEGLAADTNPPTPPPEGLTEALEQTGAEIAYWSARGAHKASLTVGGDGGPPLEVKVSMAAGQVQVEFLTAEGPMREALSRHAQHMLQGMLKTQGIELTAVSVGAHSAGTGQPMPDQRNPSANPTNPPLRPAALSAIRTTSDHWQPAQRPHAISAHKLDLFA